MKKILVLLIFIFAAISLNAQKTAQKTSPSTVQPTTEDEYLYGISGYKLQLNMKLTMKPGYTLQDYTAVEEPERKVEFKGLFRKGETAPCAIIMIYTKVRGTPNYYCIPTTDATPELWKKFNDSLIDDNNNAQPQMQFFAKSLANLAQQLAHK
jgi:hypothetical protein